MFIAYVDVLGTRALAKEAPLEYYNQMQVFQKWVFSYSPLLSPKGKVFFFSDSAYVQDEHLAPMVNFLSELRWNLLKAGVFFRGAIRRGTLNHKEASENPFQHDPELLESVKERLMGWWFDKDVAELYATEQHFKGIGILVDPKLDGMTGLRTTPSCHLPDTSIRNAVPYRDLTLVIPDRGEEHIHTILDAFFRAKTSSKRLGRYYISLLVLWVQSIALSTKRRHLLGPTLGILLDGPFEAMFRDVVGIEQVYFALLNRVDQEKEGQWLEHDLMEFVRTRKWLLNLMPYVPEDLLSYSLRKRIMEQVSRRILIPAQLFQEAIGGIRKLAANGCSDGEIARKLNLEGQQGTSSSLSWTAKSVARIRATEGILAQKKKRRASKAGALRPKPTQAPASSNPAPQRRIGTGSKKGPPRKKGASHE